MHLILRAAIVGFVSLTVARDLRAAESFAAGVVSYTAGTATGTFYTDASVVLGKPPAETGGGLMTPFNPQYTSANVVSVGAGGQLTLRLANYVTVDNTPGVREIGVWESIFLNGLAPNYDSTGNPATVTGTGRAVVQVSADNVTWFSLNSGNAITFDLPGNYYANSTGAYDPAPANPVNADFGRPFTGTVTSFSNQSYTQVVATLNNSAGGNWLDIDSSFGLTRVGFVRFNGVPAGDKLDLTAVAINGSLIGATVVPEPGTLDLLSAALVLGIARRFRRPCAT